MVNNHDIPKAVPDKIYRKLTTKEKILLVFVAILIRMSLRVVCKRISFKIKIMSEEKHKMNTESIKFD